MPHTMKSCLTFHVNILSSAAYKLNQILTVWDEFPMPGACLKRNIWKTSAKRVQLLLRLKKIKKCLA